MIPGVGDRLAGNLLTYFDNPEKVFRVGVHKLQRIPGIGPTLAESITQYRDFTRAKQELAFIDKQKVQALCIRDTEYPERLRSIDDAPFILYYKGNATLNAAKTVGIVGTRKATEYGKGIVATLIQSLVPKNALVISGMAFGIDICAHRKALEHGLPTVGVMAHGLDRIYPPQHQKYASQMMNSGGILTEFISQTIPDKVNFPMRNRIVAGLSDVLVVIETAERGGAMITAELANGYNREVMAVPGRIHDPFSLGCNTLIRENKAAVYTSASDLFALMNWDLTPRIVKPAPDLFGLALEQQHLLTYIGNKVRVGIDEMAQDLETSQATIALRLLDLELRNLIRTLPGKMYEIIA